MVEELGAFFHLTISEGGETVPLSQELKLVEIYISLQKVDSASASAIAARCRRSCALCRCRS